MPLAPWAAGLASEEPHQLSTEVSSDESKNVNGAIVDHKGSNDSATRHWPVPILVESEVEIVAKEICEKELATDRSDFEALRPRSEQSTVKLDKSKEVRKVTLLGSSSNEESLRSQCESASVEQSQRNGSVEFREGLSPRPASQLKLGQLEVCTNLLVTTPSCEQEAVSEVSFFGRMPAGSPDEVLVSTGELSLLEQMEVAAVETGLQSGKALTPEVCSSLNAEAAPFIPRAWQSGVDTRDGVEHPDADGDLVRLESTEENVNASELPTVAAVSSLGLQNQAFINGYLEGVKTKFLIDTGAEISIISEETLARFPKTLRFAFQDRTHTLVMASGERVLAKGPVLCNITVNGHTILEPVCAMSSGPQALLSMPALVALDLELTVAGEAVVISRNYSKIRRLQTLRVLRVTAAADFVIPPRSQQTITGRMEGQVFREKDYIVERVNTHKSDELLVAHTIAGHNKGQTVMRVLNPTDKEIRVSEGQWLANAEAAEVVEEVALADATPDTELPEHLKELYEDTCQKESLSETAKMGLRALLTKHSSLFAKNDDDLGQTTLVAHDIDTGEAAPV